MEDMKICDILEDPRRMKSLIKSVRVSYPKLEVLTQPVCNCY